MTSTFNTNASASASDSASASTDSDATAMSDDILSITHGIAALSLQNNPKPLLISDENKQMFDKIFKSFKRYIRLHPPAFPKREVPNDPFECRCRYCSTHDIEVKPVRYGEVTATMLNDAIKRRAKKCQRYILKIHIPDEQRKLLDDLCYNHTNISIQNAIIIREKRCYCEHCNPSSSDIAAAIKVITNRKYGLPTSNEIKRAINIFNLNCPHKLGVHFTPHYDKNDDLSIAINDALTYANSTTQHDFEFIIDSDSDLSEKNFELPSFDT